MDKGQSVTLIIYDETGEQIVLTKRRDIPVWVLPGGGIEPSESPEAAALREGAEETGYQIEIIRKVAEYLPVNRMTRYTHFFACRITGGAPQSGAETKAVSLFPLNALPRLLPHFYRDWIHDAEKKLPHLIRRKITGVTYLILLKLFLQHPLLVSRYLLSKAGLPLNN